jgi:hypothetical protein
MVRHITADFLTNPRQYQRAERYWRELWDRLGRETGVAEQWRTPWLATPLRDGDPIFSAVSTALRRGVHIIQHAPTCDAVELEAWVDRFGEQDKDEVIEQLVISCALSEEAAAVAQQLVHRWLIAGELLDAGNEASGDRPPEPSHGRVPKPKGGRGRKAS